MVLYATEDDFVVVNNMYKGVCVCFFLINFLYLFVLLSDHSYRYPYLVLFSVKPFSARNLNLPFPLQTL